MTRPDSRNSEDVVREWNRLGRVDPFWAVLSEERYRGKELSDTALQEFLHTGEEHVSSIWVIARHQFGAFAPRRALDFGCGVGRVTLPLARRVPSVVAVDAADSMLSAARRLLSAAGVTNVQLLKSDATLSSVTGPFDLVHSMLVLQHVPADTGLLLIERLADLAGETGVVVLHVLFQNPFFRKRTIPLPERLVRSVRRALHRPPEIQMNPYPLNAVFEIIQRSGVQRIHVEFTDHRGHLGAILIFRRGTAPPVERL